MSAHPTQGSPLLDIRGLTVSYPTPQGPAQVVRGVDLAVAPGERVALVGESGSGKSVTARSVLRLDPDARTGGRILLEGEDVLEMTPREVRRVRGARAGLVFQDPLASLNPVKTVGWQITQPLRIRGVGRREARRRAVDLLGRLGVADPDRRFDDHPHQFSGGMRQRVVIAIAVIAEPRLLIADEPTTALDVRVQAQVLELMEDLARERGMAVLLITHDLGIVAGFARRVAVMRHGLIVEEADVDRLYASPSHPYTRSLLDAVPRIGDAPGRRLGAPVPATTEGEAL
ncbi:ABC transporter ATP-binding protein [Nocardiopsis flavescens]|uniref:Peptide/nickel transport system ATP-binding protein/peptide/nickel transport system ATP-binding protein n=1 Tax=Nocardiopsis flavescens TaxID=758803 RepID=A0A1M6CXD6_9ACTN|nr:ABC transporter ATP-binding protein [Nocardiopsis flavescens]SHI65745.1 peptide/nickel transport system ATP-binding protein/peptide/nickel transport system ATP-binding protein [Nocardiopsis flavescens]